MESEDVTASDDRQSEDIGTEDSSQLVTPSTSATSSESDGGGCTYVYQFYIYMPCVRCHNTYDLLGIY